MSERHGFDVRDCFGGGRDWRTAWRLKDRLPRESHYKAAVAMDREVAERVAAQIPDLYGDDQAPEPPSPAGYRLTEYLLLTLIDSVRGVQAAVIAAAGVPPPDMEPMPRPQTALEVVREEQRLRDLHALVEVFAPHEREDPTTT